MADTGKTTKDAGDRIERLEEKLAFLEHDLEQLDASIRELFENVDGMKRLLTSVHAQVQSNTQQIADASDESA